MKEPKKPKKNIISFSGGKDSTALLLWAKERFPNGNFTAVWMDTGWEHPWTYDYVDKIDKELLYGELVRLKSAEYDGFVDMAKKKGRVPSAKARFCTQKLKLEPLIAYFDTLRDDFEIHNYVGIRADESFKRSKMAKCSFDLDYFGCWIHRPLLEWTADHVFKMMEKYSIEPNPLYKVGMKRVGCMPCVMSNHQDIKRIMSQFPEVIDQIKQLEQDIGQSFFPPNFIPDRFCSRSETKTKKVKKDINDMFGSRTVEIEKEVTSHYPLVDDVVEYLKSDESQTSTLDREPQSCMSHYNICE